MIQQAVGCCRYSSSLFRSLVQLVPRIISRQILICSITNWTPNRRNCVNIWTRSEFMELCHVLHESVCRRWHFFLRASWRQDVIQQLVGGDLSLNRGANDNGKFQEFIYSIDDSIIHTPNISTHCAAACLLSTCDQSVKLAQSQKCRGLSALPPAERFDDDGRRFVVVRRVVWSLSFQLKARPRSSFGSIPENCLIWICVPIQLRLRGWLRENNMLLSDRRGWNIKMSKIARFQFGSSLVYVSPLCVLYPWPFPDRNRLTFLLSHK